jgi:1-deoxy-D-xylulose-5-phosphate reductoisomerase
MSFFAPDLEKFPAVKLAYEALEKGGNMACIMNAANEAAVAAFLKEQIGFYDITDIVQECMNGAEFVMAPDLETIFNTNETILARASEMIGRISGRKSF